MLALSRALQVSFRLLQGLIVLLIVLFLLSGIRVTEQGQVAVVQHLGKVRQSSLGEVSEMGQAGLHWAWPEPIDKVIFIPVREQALDVDSFWYSEEEAGHGHHGATPETLIPGVDGYCITGDRNILHCKWTLRYRIARPTTYFLATDGQPPDGLLKSLLGRAVVRSVGSMTIDQAFLTDVEALKESVAERLQNRLRELKLGIEVSRVDLVEKAPPLQVKKAFNAALDAGTKRQSPIDEAKGFAEERKQNAEAEAARLKATAVAYKAQLKSKIASEAAALDLIFPPAAETPDPGLLRQIYLEYVSRALSKSQEIFFLHSDQEGKKRLLRVELENQAKYRVKQEEEEAPE